MKLEESVGIYQIKRRERLEREDLMKRGNNMCKVKAKHETA